MGVKIKCHQSVRVGCLGGLLVGWLLVDYTQTFTHYINLAVGGKCTNRSLKIKEK